jgi:hypothetical protein
MAQGTNLRASTTALENFELRRRFTFHSGQIMAVET